MFKIKLQLLNFRTLHKMLSILSTESKLSEMKTEIVSTLEAWLAV